MGSTRLREDLWVRDQMLDASVDCIKLIDVHGTVLHMNMSGRRALGVSAEQAAAGFGMPWLDLLVPEVQPQGRRALEQAARGELARFAGRSDGGGSVQEWDNILTPMLDADGTVTAILCVSRDVTAQRQAEERLRLARESAERAQALLSLLHDVADRANSAATLQEGLELVERALASRWGWSVLHLPDHAGLGLEELGWRVRASGRVESVSAVDGEVVYGIPVEVDHLVTDVVLLRVPAEEADAELPATLRRIGQQLARVAEREQSALALAAARDAALSAARSKAEFLAMMSHELRTPMNGVIGLGEVLLESPLDPHQRRVAEAMQEAGRTLTGLVGDVLELTRLESGGIELREDDFDVRDVVERSVRMCAPQAHLKDLELVVDIDPAVPLHLRGDGGRLGQIVTNLCGNAVKFTATGTVVVAVSSRPLGASRTRLLLTVSDSGPGIDAEYADQLFEPFVQERASIGSRAGSGLGLAITRDLAERMGGAVRLADTSERGSVFSAEIPFAHSERGEQTGTTATPLAGSAVLVAEDRQATQTALRRTLAGWGAEVVVASSAAELRSVVATRAWAAILVASSLPGLDLADLVADPTTRAAVVLVPGLGSEAELRAHGVGLRTLASPASSAHLQQVVAPPRTGATDASRASRRGPALRVLVVDDDATNQLVAGALLSTLGCSSVTVDDGAAAVAWMTAHPGRVDAVLMDCRMPVLDGYDATRQLRAAGVTVPIIGCTADGTAAARERCRGAGMDDVLVKPLRRDDLARVIECAHSGPAAPDLPDVDLERIAELRAAGEDVFEHVREVFLDRLSDRIDDVATAATPDLAVRAAHSLVGAAGNIGAARLARAARRLEEHFRADRTTGAAPLLEELRESGRLASDALRAL